MAEHHHHHHRKYKKDSSTIFKEKTFKQIELRKKLEKAIKIILIIIAILMGLAVIFVYKFG